MAGVGGCGGCSSLGFGGLDRGEAFFGFRAGLRGGGDGWEGDAVEVGDFALGVGLPAVAGEFRLGRVSQGGSEHRERGEDGAVFNGCIVRLISF